MSKQVRMSVCGGGPSEGTRGSQEGRDKEGKHHSVTLHYPSVRVKWLTRYSSNSRQTLKRDIGTLCTSPFPLSSQCFTEVWTEEICPWVGQQCVLSCLLLPFTTKETDSFCPKRGVGELIYLESVSRLAVWAWFLSELVCPVRTVPPDSRWTGDCESPVPSRKSHRQWPVECRG